MNLYILLGVRREATVDEIKRAYRRLARKYHPDINPGDREAAEVFRRISSAYETLVDPERRREYDRGVLIEGSPVASTFEFAGFDFSVSAASASASTFGDLFADALRANRGGAGAETGADVHASVTLTFDQAMHGAPATLQVTRLERCAPCGGAGRLEGPEIRCIQCDGSGQVRSVRGHMVFARTCPACGGEGVMRYRTCRACGGEGVGVHTGTIDVHLPPGVQDGAHLVIPEEGHAGRRGGRAGALHLDVTVQPHPFLRRVGDDLYLEVPVAVHEAALGARFEIPGVDGPIRLRVPPGTQSGQTFRLRERGAPRAGGQRGDLIVTLRLVLPPLLDERSRELLREFGARNPGDVRAAWRASETAGTWRDTASRPAEPAAGQDHRKEPDLAGARPERVPASDR
jgi:molecular chaperone DnaJ